MLSDKFNPAVTFCTIISYINVQQTRTSCIIYDTVVYSVDAENI